MNSLYFALHALFLLAGIAAIVFVIIKRRCFDLWTAIPACSAWILRGLRMLAFDGVQLVLKKLDTPQFVEVNMRTSIIFLLWDTLICILLSVVLIRLLFLGLYRYWYQRAKQELRE